MTADIEMSSSVSGMLTAAVVQELAMMQLNGKSSKGMSESKELKKSLFKRLIPGLKG